ncbi:dihydrofolate reductase family protein [Microlunatus sp. GCM10028923]|uniref:dihydrofolate reductase family protein n=1 Tax=Microlunatus sp. GCM10028923 TaxID=3273400 RepID=UPI0036137E8E
MIMGSLKASLFISLDGVTEDPDTWHFPYFDDQMGEIVGRLMGEAEATLIGRKTYEEFAAYWPDADPDDPITQQMNGSRKYVVSTTLTEPDWQNTAVINGDIAAELTSLKADTNLGTAGSPTLVRWLVEQGLADELHLLLHPVVAGRGQTLFGDSKSVPLTLLDSTALDSGVVHLVYGRAR